MVNTTRITLSLLATFMFLAGCSDRSNTSTLAIDVSKMDDEKVQDMKVLLGNPVAMSPDGKVYYYSTIPISERAQKTPNDNYAENMANVAGMAVVYGVIVVVEIGCKILLNYRG